MSFDLSDEQADVVKNVVSRALLRHPVTTVTGHAGTGKTCVLLEVANRLGGQDNLWVVAAPTNKACSVITKKGKDSDVQIEARTIHSLTTKPNWDIGTVKEAADIYQKTRFQGRLDARQKSLVQPHFISNDMRKPLSGIIIDEASMLTKFMLEKAQGLNIPIVMFGDPGQLKPVDQHNKGWSAIAHSDFHLSKVHRNGGDILAIADHVRHGGIAKEFKTSQNGNVMMTKSKNDITEFNPGVILAYKNATVFDWNNRARRIMGRGGGKVNPVAGDRLVLECKIEGTRLIKSSIVTVLWAGEPHHNQIAIQYQADSDEGEDGGKTYESIFDWSFFDTSAPEGQPPVMRVTPTEWGEIMTAYESGLKRLSIESDMSARDTMNQINKRQRELSDNLTTSHKKFVEMVSTSEWMRQMISCITRNRKMVNGTLSPSDPFPGEHTAPNPVYAAKARYAYAMTVHKSQGSEWGKVAVVQDMNESHDDYREWAYTAATRAKSELLWLSA